MPKLSVITICYNDKTGLEKTMRSVFAQEFSDYEYIVIDGGSTDGSADFIRENAERLSFWVSEKDNGIYHAQNKGWQNSKGEYCLFLNAGDYLVNDKTLSDFCSTELKAEIVYGDLMVDNGKDAHYRLGQPFPFSFEDFIYTTLFHPAAFIKRTLLEERKGYDESFRIVADYDFFMEMILVKKVSTEYRSIPVSVFNTSGIGSDPANKIKHDEERRRSQIRYFSIEKIEEAERNVQKRKPRTVRIQESVSGIPIVRELTNFGLLMYNRIRKAGR